MSATDVDAAVQDYLGRLDKALAPLPHTRRQQLVAEITDHIAAARSQLDDPTEADIRNLLDRIGRPEDIAAEACTTEAPRQSRPSQDNLAIALLLFGGFLVIVGWFVGVFLLWTSSVWPVRDKVLGTLLFPGGLVLPLLVGAILATIGPLAWIAAFVLLVIPVLVAIHLYRVAHR